MLKFSPRSHTLLALAVVGGVAVSTLVAAPKPGHHWGTDILHFFDRTAMVSDGVISNATGQVQANQNTQGHADNQRLDISVKNLGTNTTFQLLALVNDDTNYTAVAEFTTDAKGRANISYRKVGSSNGHANLGHGRAALPALLDPLSNVRELAVAQYTTQRVMVADLTTPDKLEYLIKRDLSTNDVSALLRIHSNLKQAQFQLQALGLSPTNDYWLVVNGAVVQTNTTDAKGRLNIKTVAETPEQILDLRTLGVWDTSSNVVLCTTLP
jgi:hypothetical protein